MKSIRFLSGPTRQRGFLFVSVSLFALVALSIVRPSAAAVKAAPVQAAPAAQAVSVAQAPARSQGSKTSVARPGAAAKARAAQARPAATPTASFPSSLDRLRGSAFGTPPFVGIGVEISCVAPGGLWSSGSTWSGGVVPSGADNVTITNGCTVTIDTAASSFNLTVFSGGVLEYEDAVART